MYLIRSALHQQRRQPLLYTAVHDVETRAAAMAVRLYTIGAAAEGGSQQKAKEMQATLPPFVPNPQPVSIVHKMGLQLLRDPWFNKGELHILFSLVWPT